MPDGQLSLFDQPVPSPLAARRWRLLYGYRPWTGIPMAIVRQEPGGVVVNAGSRFKPALRRETLVPWANLKAEPLNGHLTYCPTPC